jgi:hypothetical protein
MYQSNWSKMTRTILMGSMLATAVMTGTTAFAGTVNNTATEINSAKSTVRFLGTDEDNFWFHVQYNNPSGNNFFLTLLDENGEEIYSGKFSDKVFTKRFSLSRFGEYKTISFVIESAKSQYKERFDVQFKQRSEEEVVVIKK